MTGEPVRRNRQRARNRERGAARPTIADRFEAADHLLAGTVTDAGGVWSRATSWILRLAVEQAVDELWARREPALARCPMRAQLLALRLHAGTELAARIAAVWTALSRAAHHHDYELAPSVTELRRWREQAEEFADALAALA
ncbi:hypothetical protein [Nocardia jiangsuensis]|uniref:DUF86 domain-containing protein n=1 Tax=Nocardia jiangsuensis TaxID=1691563 RepID=A0ABV8DR13_9NOCA